MACNLARRVLPLCAGAMLLAAAAPAQNLVTNGDFAHDATGWINPSPSTVALVYRDDVGSTLLGGSGPGCLEVQHRAWNGGGNGPRQVLTVTPNTTFNVSAAAFVPDSADNVLHNVAVVVEWRTSDDASILYLWLTPGSIVRGQWLSITGQVTAPSDAARVAIWLMAVNEVAQDETRPGVALFDDVSVAEQGATAAVQQLFVPVASSKRGNNNTFWTTDLWVMNETAVAVQLSGAVLRPSEDNSAAVNEPTVLATVPAGGAVSVSDVVGSLGASITGALFLEASAPGSTLPATLVKVASRNSTPNPGGSGGYGQFVPAEGAGSANRVVAPGAFQGASYRTNAGILNTSPDSLQVSVEIVRADGTQAAHTSWALKPYEPRMVGLPALGVSALEGGYLVFTRTSSRGSFLAYISVVDQNTGDSILIVAH